MIEKQIELLRNQVEKLNDKKFDLEAWKNHTIILLDGIFGNESQKIKQIEKIEYEYNSWSLRDTSGNNIYLDSCKKIGREVLEASITELETLGTPVKTTDQDKISVNIILDALDDELKGSQFKAMIKLLKSEQSAKEKSRQLRDIIKELESETIINILQSIILHEDFVNAIPEK